MSRQVASLGDGWTLHSKWKVISVVFLPTPLQVVSALESNPTARRTQLHHKFEQVIALVEDNIYECCSEAWTSRRVPFFSPQVISFSCWQLPFPNKSYLGMMPTEAKAFPKVSLLRRREKWQGKGLNPLKHHFLFLFLLISECQGMILNVSLWHRQTFSLAQLYREHEGALHLWTLQWVGPTVSPGGNLKHWTLFLRANESQWCTALYYNVHSNIYRCVIL